MLQPYAMGLIVKLNKKCEDTREKNLLIIKRKLVELLHDKYDSDDIFYVYEPDKEDYLGLFEEMAGMIGNFKPPYNFSLNTAVEHTLNVFNCIDECYNKEIFLITDCETKEYPEIFTIGIGKHPKNLKRHFAKAKDLVLK